MKYQIEGDDPEVLLSHLKLAIEQQADLVVLFVYVQDSSLVEEAIPLILQGLLGY